MTIARSSAAIAAIFSAGTLARQGSAQACDGSIRSVAILKMAFSVTSDCAGKADGETCTATCSEGFAASPEGVSSTQFTCTTDTFVKADGEGDLVCAATPCSAASYPSGTGVAHDCEGLTITEECEAFCEAGYEGTAQTFTCLSSGDFSGVAVTCKGPCDDSAATVAILRETGVNASACLGALADGECEAACETGYAAPAGGASSTTFTCSGGSFVKKDGEGDLVCAGQACTTFPSGDYIDHSDCDGKVTGETCQVACAAGFRGRAKNATCGADGAFEYTEWEPLCIPLCDATGYPHLSDWFDAIAEDATTLSEIDEEDARMGTFMRDMLPGLKAKICEHKEALGKMPPLLSLTCDMITRQAMRLMRSDSACACGGKCEVTWDLLTFERDDEVERFTNPTELQCRYATCYVSETCAAAGTPYAQIMDNLTAMVESECSSYASAVMDGAEPSRKPFAPIVAAMFGASVALF